MSLKLLFLGLALCLFVCNLAYLLNLSIYLKNIPKVLSIFLGVQIHYQLYNHKYSKTFNIIAGVLLALVFFNIYSFSHINTQSSDSMLWVRRFFRFAIIGCILFFSISFYKSMSSYLERENLYAQRIKKWTKLTIALFVLSLANNILPVFGDKTFLVTRYVSTVIHSITCLFIIYRPSFINRIELAVGISKLFNKSDFEKVDQGLFVHEFYGNSYFLNQDANLEEFSKKINSSPTALKEYVLLHSRLGFKDLVNKSRVDYFITLVNSQQYYDLTLDAIAEKCGFGSRQSLHRYFKQFHGGSPSDLFKLF